MHKLSAMLESGPLDAENLMEYAKRLTQLSGCNLTGHFICTHKKIIRQSWLCV